MFYFYIYILIGLLILAINFDAINRITELVKYSYVDKIEKEYGTEVKDLVIEKLKTFTASQLSLIVFWSFSITAIIAWPITIFLSRKKI